jgi:hypothetical protein
MKLSTLAIALGLLVFVPHLMALLKPAPFAAALRKFPRSEMWGFMLMGLGTVWFLWNVHIESLADFAAYKNMMLFGFGAVGVLACIFVRDFLAVRGLAVVLLLMAKLMLDTARWYDSSWRLVISVLAYVWILAGMWFIISPWRLRDIIQWATANERRIRVGSAIRLCVGLLLIGLGLTAFRADELQAGSLAAGNHPSSSMNAAAPPR